MDVIEPLWFAVTTAHDLLKASKEVAGEMRDLGDTLKLISIAIRPLLNEAKASIELSAGDDLTEVVTTIKYVLSILPR